MHDKLTTSLRLASLLPVRERAAAAALALPHVWPEEAVKGRDYSTQRALALELLAADPAARAALAKLAQPLPCTEAVMRDGGKPGKRGRRGGVGKRRRIMRRAAAVAALRAWRMALRPLPDPATGEATVRRVQLAGETYRSPWRCMIVPGNRTRLVPPGTVSPGADTDKGARIGRLDRERRRA